MLLIAEVGSSDPLSQLTGYGALGLVVLGAVLGQIRFKPELTALREYVAERDREHADERRRMQDQIDTMLSVHHDRVLPALLGATEALRESAAQTSDVVAAVKQLDRAIAGIESALRGRGR